MSDLLYTLMLACFLTHELDAVRCGEWRILPGLRRVDERAAEPLFIWLHIPAFTAILWAGSVSEGFRIALSIFAAIHVALHVAFRKHPEYRFNSLGSWLTITFAGVFGLAYAALVLWPAG